MEIYKKLPTDLQKKVDRMLHEINFYETLKEFQLPIATCDICKCESSEGINIYNPGFVELCKACIQPCHYKMVTLNETTLIKIFQCIYLSPFFDTK